MKIQLCKADAHFCANNLGKLQYNTMYGEVGIKSLEQENVNYFAQLYLIL